MTRAQRASLVESPLRWAGSKRAIVPRLLERIPNRFGRYVEPFFGSGCLFFALQPEAALISDYNVELIEFYRQLRRSPARVHQLASRWAEPDYYEVRALDPTTLEIDERAARFLFLNRYAFNGVYRTNRLGRFNVPKGTRTSGIPALDSLRRTASTLKGRRLAACDYATTTAKVERDDFVYLDPPYVNANRATYGEYGYGGFGGQSDVARLARELVRLDELGARVLLSFGSIDGLEDALDGWQIEHVSSPRRVAASLTSRTANTSEILAWNR